MSAQPHCFVLAGGRGTRFWPLSRRAKPKQLLDFTGEGSLLALTLQRVGAVVPPERQWVLTSEELREQVVAEAPDLPPAQILCEPCGRNTAPAIALAAAVLERTAPSSPFAVLPSDHLIQPAEHFQDCLRTALDHVAAHEDLLTFGIAPTRPETGYGYIESGEQLTDGLRRVRAFREKPDAETAAAYLAGGRHFWNSGMFAWRSDVVLAGIAAHEPAIAGLAQDLASKWGTEDFATAFKARYAGMPSISIDYALMERAANVVVLPATFDWNDLGHWLAMRELWPRDASGNATRDRLLALDAADNIVLGEGRLTALVGVNDLVVVQTKDVTLVCSADRAQEVRRVLEALESQGDDQHL